MVQQLRGLTLLTIIVFVPIHMLTLAEVARSEYPEKAISILVGFDPGSPSDLIGRVVSIGAEKDLGQPIVFENKSGAGGSLALAMVANAKPDGYTLCCTPSDAIIYTPQLQKVPFKPLKSFTPIIGIAAAQHTALLVKSDAPWKTFDEFLSYAKRNPGKIKYSSTGVGTSMHVIMEYIAYKEGIKWVHVPYKGTPPARTALLGGHVDACSGGVDWPPFVRSGQLRVLVTYGEQRSPHFPDVPSLKEYGYDFKKGTIHSILGPAGLPPNVLKKLETAFARGRETHEFKTAVEKLYLSPAYYTGNEYAQYLKELWSRSEKVLKDTGIIKEPATQPY